MKRFEMHLSRWTTDFKSKQSNIIKSDTISGMMNQLKALRENSDLANWGTWRVNNIIDNMEESA